MRKIIYGVPMLILQLFFGTLTLVTKSAQALWAKVRGKPYDSGMD